MSSKVKELNKSLKEGNVVIAFFMTGCHWCDELKPVWNKLKKKYSPKKIKDITVSPTNFSILDGLNCDTSDTTKGFPCICSYTNGKKNTCFKGERNEATLTNFMNKYIKKSNDAKGSKKRYKTSKTKRKKRRRSGRKKTKKKRRRRKKSKARSAFYRKLNRKIKKKY